MKKEIILLGICYSLFFSAYKELAPMGPTRTIKEESALVAMKNAYDKIDKEKLKQDLIASAKTALQANYDLPLCIAEKEVEVPMNKKIPFEIPEFDITQETMKQGKKYVPEQRFLIINLEEKSEYEWLKTTHKSGDGIIVVNGNYRDARLKNFPNKYIANQDFMQRYKVRCTPTELIINSDGAKMVEKKIRRFQ